VLVEFFGLDYRLVCFDWLGMRVILAPLIFMQVTDFIILSRSTARARHGDV